MQRFYTDVHDGVEANVAVGGMGIPPSTELADATEVAGMYDETLDHLAEPVPYEPRVADLIATWIDQGSGLYSFVDVSRSSQNCWRSAGGTLDAVDDAPRSRSTALNEIERGILPEIGWWDRHG